MIQIFTSEKYKTETGQNLVIALQGLDAQCIYEGMKIGLKQPDWWYECWNSVDEGGETTLNSDLVELGILPKQISEYTDADIGSIISIPYSDSSGKILLNNGCIEFEVVGVNHHTSEEHQQTITLMTKNIIRCAAFDATESKETQGNARWPLSNIRQWLNSSGAANEWFTPQHDYDEAPSVELVYGEAGAYANEPGFLAGFSPEVLQHFTDITNITALYEDDGSGFETTVDKVFLPSYTEMFGKANDVIDYYEGTHLSIRYPNNNSRIKNGTDVNSYWMRSLYVTANIRSEVHQ